jgi:hypothetical protein
MSRCYVRKKDEEVEAGCCSLSSSIMTECSSDFWGQGWRPLEAFRKKRRRKNGKKYVPSHLGGISANLKSMNFLGLALGFSAS